MNNKTIKELEEIFSLTKEDVALIKPGNEYNPCNCSPDNKPFNGTGFPISGLYIEGTEDLFEGGDLYNWKMQLERNFGVGAGRFISETLYNNCNCVCLLGRREGTKSKIYSINGHKVIDVCVGYNQAYTPLIIKQITNDKKGVGCLIKDDLSLISVKFIFGEASIVGNKGEITLIKTKKRLTI